MTNVHARFHVGLFTAAALCLLVRPTGAATELQPGLWQEAETGSENGQPAKTETNTRCMTPEEARQPSKGLVADAELRKHCKALDFERTGDRLTFQLQCATGALQVTMDATFTIDTPQHYAGSIKASLTLGPIKLSVNKTVDARRIGDCPQKQ
jgi:hypothetical protein